MRTSIIYLWNSQIYSCIFRESFTFSVQLMPGHNGKPWMSIRYNARSMQNKEAHGKNCVLALHQISVPIPELQLKKSDFPVTSQDCIYSKMTSTKITNLKDGKEFLEANKEAFVVLIFDAEFTEQQDLVGDCVNAITQSPDLKDKIVLELVDAEKNNELAAELSVLSVPMVVCIVKGQTVRKIDTLDPVKLVTTLKEELVKSSLFSGESSDEKADPKEKFNEYLKKLTNRAPVMIFMKGDPSTPRCGFSKQLVGILSTHDIKYESFDILQDEEVRQGLKEYSDWPTYPQIYVKGEFIGGLDILKQMEESGELETLKV